MGVVAYNGYTGAAKVSSTKANHKGVCKWTNAELAKCNIDSSASIFNGQISCSTIISKLNSQNQNPAGDMHGILEKAYRTNFKNPYGAYTEAYGDSAVRSMGWNKDRDLGYTIVDTRCCHGNTNRYAVLNIHVYVINLLVGVTHGITIMTTKKYADRSSTIINKKLSP